MLITSKNKKIFFLPILLLTIATAVPFFNLLRGGLKFENSQKTFLTAFLVVPGVPVFSTDDFFEYVSFKALTQSGKSFDIKWQQLINDKYSSNFMQYVYLRHIFNTRKNYVPSKRSYVVWAMKSMICRHPEKFNLNGDKIVSVEYFVSRPFELNTVAEKMTAVCDE